MRDARTPVCAAALLALLAGLSACSPTGAAVRAGSAAGTAVAQERSVGDAVSDAWIVSRINYLWATNDLAIFRKLSTSVVEGRVLLTGAVRYPETRIEAVRLAWQVDGVSQVIDEIQVEDSGGVIDAARDLWITTQLKSKLLFDPEVHSLNYNVDTVNGVVYLMGIAADEAELARVRGHARNIGRVRNIVSYVRLRDDPDRRRS